MRWSGRYTCEVCRKTFAASRRDSRFCSNTCRQRAHRRKQQMQREKARALSSIGFIQKYAQIHPDLREEAMAMLNEILAVTTASVTHSAQGD